MRKHRIENREAAAIACPAVLGILLADSAAIRAELMHGNCCNKMGLPDLSGLYVVGISVCRKWVAMS
jgi:hypothetical protein